MIGGGINGCGIARDAAGRGLRCCCRAGRLAQATSSASTKLFHGGLRYLEYYEFRLVREALVERETLLRAMPHIARPLRFVLPHHAGLRPAWMLRLGLLIYDHLGRAADPAAGRGRWTSAATRRGVPLKPGFGRAFEYSDCWVDDARLVVLNARDAAARGATILHADPLRARGARGRRLAAAARRRGRRGAGAGGGERRRALGGAGDPRGLRRRRRGPACGWSAAATS